MEIFRTHAREASITHVRNLWAGKATLAEGPAWDVQGGLLWFVDIKQRLVHRYDPCGGAVQSWTAPAQVGWVLPGDGATLIAGLQTGLAEFDPQTGNFTHMVSVEPERPGNRLNDATVAADGSIWFGTMDDGECEATGRVYRWDGCSISAAGIDPVVITNGPAISPEGRTLYHVDTAGGIIYAVPLDQAGSTGEVREFARIDPADGHPDGVTVDAAGNVWLGLWGGGRARLYSPGGQILREVPIPASNVTKIALGGPDLKTAYVTTARAGLDAEELQAQPEAGSLFAFEVDVSGLPLPLVRNNRSKPFIGSM